MTRLRSLLFAPGNRPEYFPKLVTSGADGIVLDLEDAVPPAAKRDAREEVRGALPSLLRQLGAARVFVRVNGPKTGWFQDDLEIVRSAGSGVVVPKLESLDELGATGGWSARVEVVAGIETVAAVEAAPALCHAPVTAAYFGAEDLVADLGGRRTQAGLEVLYARTRVAFAARLGGVRAIDQVVIDLDDDVRFRREADEARALGYTGKLCIHPRQVALANDAFTPSAEELEMNQRLVEAFERARREGRGVIDFDGRMVDQPVYQRAIAVLKAAEDGSGTSKESGSL